MSIPAEQQRAGSPGKRASGAPVASRRSGSRRLAGSKRVLVPLIAGVLLFALWQLLAWAFAPDFVARPSQVLPRIPAVLTDPAFLSGAGDTFLAVIEGVAIAIAIGTVPGLVIGRVPDADRFARFYVSSFYAMPLVALIPLVTLWLGYTATTRLVIIVFAAVMPIIFNVAEGARSVPREYLDVARAYRARWHHIWFGVTVPASLPYLLAGFSIAIGRALVAAVTAEFLTSVQGLGYFVLINNNTFHQDDAAVGTLALALVGTFFFVATRILTQKVLPWYRPA